MHEYILESLQYPAMLINKNRVVEAINGKAQHTGICVGKHCWDTFGHRAAIDPKDRKYFEEKGKTPKKGIQCVFCMADTALSTQTEQVTDLNLKGITLETHWLPINENQYIHYAFQK